MSTSPPLKGLTYKDAGVDTVKGDALLDRLQHLCQRTHSTRVLGKYGTTGGGASLFRLDFPEKIFQRNYKAPVPIAPPSSHHAP